MSFCSEKVPQIKKESLCDIVVFIAIFIVFHISLAILFFG